MLTELVTALAFLVIIVYAFARILHMEKELGRAIGTLLAGGVRLSFIVIATLLDVIITAGLMAYHALVARRPNWVGDDIAGFLHRLNDRLLRLAIR